MKDWPQRLRQSTSADRAVSPVVGIVLLVAVTVVVAASVGYVAVGTTDRIADEPSRMSTVDLVGAQVDDESVESFEGSLDSGLCQRYHLVIELVHEQGEPLDSEDLAYSIELVGETGTTLTGTFNTSVAEPGASTTAGDSIFIAIDSDSSGSSPPECGSDYTESKSAVLLGGDLAWDPDKAGQVGDLYNTHNTYLDPTSTDNLAAVTVRIEHVPTGTIVVEDRTTRIVDTS